MPCIYIYVYIYVCVYMRCKILRQGQPFGYITILPWPDLLNYASPSPVAAVTGEVFKASIRSTISPGSSGSAIVCVSGNLLNKSLATRNVIVISRQCQSPPLDPCGSHFRNGFGFIEKML